MAALALLAAAGPAQASTAHGSWSYDGYSCSADETTAFVAAPGERNVVTVGEANILVVSPFWLGPCAEFRYQASSLVDPGATIRPSGTCRFAVSSTNRAVSCPMEDGLTVSLGDGDDSFTLVDDGLSATVSCGPGNDTVIGNVNAASDCETVLPG